jgi:glycogen operon protein
MHGLTDEPVVAGLPDPLGVTVRDGGLNVAIWSGGAEAVDFCIRHDDGSETRYRLPERTDGVHHGFIPQHGVGTKYGFRVHGAWDPVHGARWNPNKLLLDPYARAIAGELKRNPAIYAHKLNPYSPEDDSQMDDRDSAPYVPYCIVTESNFDWGGVRRPYVPWAHTVVYEAHVKSMTKLHPDVPVELRGTYAGMAHDSVIGHLQSIGVTTIELLPVHQSMPEEHLVGAGMANHWGYNTIGFFAPHAGYSASGTNGEQINEFKAMVKKFHEAGIEVVLDVVYNHTAEAGQRGPTVCFRGIDNAGYYRIADDRRYYRDYTGCGNTLDLTLPHVLRMVMDSMRYWVTEMQVDGFRFDLATAMVRGQHDIDMFCGFLQACHQDPVIRTVKLIAEPWDAAGGYAVGQFPPQWSEWNDKYRDTLRDFWRGASNGIADLGWRVSGSADLYAASRRKPRASINFITCHDGFTLRDLVSYNQKHNIANGEMNRDGSNDNRSWNHGTEGPTTDAAVLELRARQQRNMLASLALSMGVPMINMGDEINRSQRGNNNAYCQDNEISWMDWEFTGAESDLLAFTQKVFGLRHEHPTLTKTYYRWGQQDAQTGVKDLAWFGPNGDEVTREYWADGNVRTVGMFIGGEPNTTTRESEHDLEIDDSFLVIYHAGPEVVPFTLPGIASEWSVELNTAHPRGEGGDNRLPAGKPFLVESRSLVVLKARHA